MEHTLFVNGKKYITAREASALFGYESDYVGQLIRAGRVAGKLVGRSWFLDPEELEQYMKNRSREARGRKRGSRAQVKPLVARVHTYERLPQQSIFNPSKLPGAGNVPDQLLSWWPTFFETEVQKSLLPESIPQSAKADTNTEAPQSTELHPVADLGTTPLSVSLGESREEVSKNSPQNMLNSPALNATTAPISPHEDQIKERIVSGERRVPITYHPDAHPLIPALTKPMKTDIVAAPPSKQGAKALLVPAGVVTAQTLTIDRYGYLRSLGKLLAAAFALSAFLFAVLSGFLSGTYAVTRPIAQIATPPAPAAFGFIAHVAINVYLALGHLLQL